MRPAQRTGLVSGWGRAGVVVAAVLVAAIAVALQGAGEGQLGPDTSSLQSSSPQLQNHGSEEGDASGCTDGDAAAAAVQGSPPHEPPAEEIPDPDATQRSTLDLVGRAPLREVRFWWEDLSFLPSVTSDAPDAFEGLTQPLDAVEFKLLDTVSPRDFWGFDDPRSAVSNGALDVPSVPALEHAAQRAAAQAAVATVRGIRSGNGTIRFAEKYRNPCWWEPQVGDENDEGKKRLRCIPYFLLIGLPKAGTTDFAVRLQKLHPHVQHQPKKENHFWSYGRQFFEGPGDDNPPPPLRASHFESDYVDIFDFPSQRLQATGAHKRVFGDLSGTALWSVVNTAPSYHLGATRPQLLRAMHPANETRFVLLVRHPTDRLFSEFRFYLENGRLGNQLGSVPDAAQRDALQAYVKAQGSRPPLLDADSFHRFVLLKLGEWRRCIATHRGDITGSGNADDGHMWQCMFARGRTALAPHMGIYATLLRRWFTEVGYRRDFLKVVKLEDYKKNMEGVLGEVLSFLGLDPSLIKSGQVGKAPINRGANRFKMHSKTRLLLDAFYAPFNEALADVLGDESFRHWRSESSVPPQNIGERSDAPSAPVAGLPPSRMLHPSIAADVAVGATTAAPRKVGKPATTGSPNASEGDGHSRGSEA